QGVARGARSGGAVRGAHRLPPAPELRAVDVVVVGERREVDELDRNAGGHRRRLARRRREEDEQRPQPLAARAERLGADRAGHVVVPSDGIAQPLLELLHVLGEPRCIEHERARHTATPVWSATIPPAQVRQRTSSKPARRNSSASAPGPGNRFTLAGRYEYADP